jgi:hypothetical protein
VHCVRLGSSFSVVFLCVPLSSDVYEILCKYKNQELFKGLSIKKLELSNTILHPTVDEIANFIGLPQKP